MKCFLCLCLFIGALKVETASAARLKDVANVRGVRSNQLIGYGLVVGLKGTGDSKLEFTNQSFKRMLDKMGLKLTSAELAGKNVAAVLITADLPAFARSGNKMDITVSSIGDASSLRGGTLVQTPLKAADQQVYAVAQGALLLGADNTHTTVARLPQGAIIERDSDTDFSQRQMFRLTLHQPDFTTAARVAKTVNMDLGGQYATAVDATTVDIVVPFSYQGKGVELLAGIESLNVETDMRARVVINEKTGTVVIGENVRVKRVAISHGDLTIKINDAGPSSASKPTAPPLDITPESVTLSSSAATKAETQTDVKSDKSSPPANNSKTPETPIALRGPASVPVPAPPAPIVASPPSNAKPIEGAVAVLEGTVNVGDLVRTLNQMGVTPKDLIVILQNLKAAGALEGELEIL